MSVLKRIEVGVQAGLMAGAVVAAAFFVADLARLTPLATPISLSTSFLGPNFTPMDSPLLFNTVALLSFGGHLAAVTLAHLAAFATLGALAVVICHAFDLPLNLLTAALYGLVVFSLAFYAAAWLTNAAGVVDLPSIRSVLLVNLLAGAVMGGYWQLASKKVGQTA